jgi:phosphonate transport system substrate-binding protein
MGKQIVVIAILLLLILSSGFFVYFRFFSNNSPLTITESPFAEMTLRIGTISSSPKKNLTDYSLLAGYIKSKLGLKNVEVIVARTPLEMAVLLKQNKEDVFIDNPFSSYALHATSGSDIVLNTIEDGASSYRSVFIVTQAGKMQKLSDLNGKMIAFKESDSASAYFLPKAELRRRGFTLTEKDGPNSKVNREEIGYYFSNDTEATIEHLFKGKVPAGAMSESNFKEYIDEYEGRFKVIDYTPLIAQHVVSFKKELDPNLKQAVIETLLAAHQAPTGVKAMKELDIEQFELLTSQPQLIKDMTELSSYIQDETLTH